MIETFVGGIDGHREWMVQVITCDLNGGNCKNYSQKICNLIVKIVKIKAYNFMSIDQF